MQPVARVPIEHLPMHPDDFEAHYAWVTAKRSQDLFLKESRAEKPVQSHIHRMKF